MLVSSSTIPFAASSSTQSRIEFSRDGTARSAVGLCPVRLAADMSAAPRALRVCPVSVRAKEVGTPAVKTTPWEDSRWFRRGDRKLGKYRRISGVKHGMQAQAMPVYSSRRLLRGSLGQLPCQEKTTWRAWGGAPTTILGCPSILAM